MPGSRRLYGILGGLLSLALWVFCPNILAHARLATSDMGRDGPGSGGDLCILGEQPTSAHLLALTAAGIMLGLAQPTKFTMLVLDAVWPFPVARGGWCS